MHSFLWWVFCEFQFGVFWVSDVYFICTCLKPLLLLGSLILKEDCPVKGSRTCQTLEMCCYSIFKFTNFGCSCSYQWIAFQCSPLESYFSDEIGKAENRASVYLERNRKDYKLSKIQNLAIFKPSSHPIIHVVTADYWKPRLLCGLRLRATHHFTLFSTAALGGWG